MSQQVATFNKRSLNSRPFGEDGCPVRLNNNKPCGETRGLDIIMEFHKLYEDKLRQIDVSAGGDGLKAKIELQQAWINDLTEQNRMLAIAVEELELEAIDRVQMLEEKLQNSARSLCEDEGKLDEKDRVIRELQERLESVGTTEVEEELRNKKQEYEELQQSMLDMREALTEEVANKHDIISLLRRDVYQLEERCLTADKQTAFKDDIIKELRKEIKKLKQENSRLHKKSRHFEEVSFTEKLIEAQIKNAEYMTVSHSQKLEKSNNSAVIYINEDVSKLLDEPNDNNQLLVFSSDSSDYVLKPSDATKNASSVISDPSPERLKKCPSSPYLCRSENDVPCSRGTKERSKLTASKIISSNDIMRRERLSSFLNGSECVPDRVPKRTNIPKHMPVKTYINNIEYIKEV